MGGIFYESSFILGTKQNVHKNFLLRVEREVKFPWEHPFFSIASCSELQREERSSQDKMSLQKQCNVGSDSRKAVNSLVPDISAYCSISNSTVRPVRPWDDFSIVPENKHFYFYGARQIEPFTLHCFECFVRSGFLSAFIVI